jgi:hypothetical protein
MAYSIRAIAEAKRDQFKLAGCGLFAQVLWVINIEMALRISDEPGEAHTIEK